MDMFLYDVQTYTKLDINENVSSSEVIESTYVVGKDSGAKATLFLLVQVVTLTLLKHLEDFLEESNSSSMVEKKISQEQ